MRAANSFAAFQHAKRVHADAVEADLRLTADETVVCLHDVTLPVGSTHIAVEQLSCDEIARRVPSLATLADVVNLGLPLYLDIKETSQRAKLAILQNVIGRSDAARFIVGVSSVEESVFLADSCAMIQQVALMLSDHQLEDFASKRPGQWIRLHEPRATPSRIANFRDHGVKIMVTCGPDASRSGHIDPMSFPELMAVQPDAVVVNDPALALREIARSRALHRPISG